MAMYSLPTDARLLFIGGALDGYTRLLARHALPQHHYVPWFASQQVRQFVSQSMGNNLVLIGHSYGASTAATLVANGLSVHTLITLDPVGWQRPALANIPGHCQLWLNFRAADRRHCFANLVARAGGWWQHRPRAFAHQHIDIAFDHALMVTPALKMLGLNTRA